jgi:transcriptional regulator with GAF, ATPase, and Fis domain
MIQPPMSHGSLEQHIQEVELENSNLASLYVALSQLHSSLDVNEVLGVIVEILLNFVGADTFAVMVADEGGTLRPIAAHGVARGAVPSLPSEGLVGRALATGAPQYGTFVARRPAARLGIDPMVCVPLHAAGEVMGAIPVWSFLQQKEALTPIDHEIIQLMSKSAGTALEAARLAMTAPPQPGARGYYEAFAELIR